ncbi:MAG TPA: branched-chain amino acid ABC transporter permease [Nocardioides sp.]|nr:branched-chain amino acid ABC transporter permease [Nocardioides sp.]
MTAQQNSTVVAPPEPTRSPVGIERRRHPIVELAKILVTCLVIAFAVPTVVHDANLFLVTTAVIYAVFAMGTNVLFGWTGISSFGQAAFFGTGAYAVGLTKDHIESPILAVLVAGLAAGVMALLFAALAGRITGVEFAMLTLIFGQILWMLTFRMDALHGENGIPAISRGELFGQNLFLDDKFWWFAVIVATVVVLGLAHIRRSSLGASMNAVRDDPLRAAALGIDVRLVRALAFTIAGVVAGVAGGLMAQQQGLVTPEILVWALSGEVIVMCLIGGMRTFWGPAVGAVILTVVEHYLFDKLASPDFFVGLALLVVVLLAPGGLLSLTTVFRRVRRRVAR